MSSPIPVNNSQSSGNSPSSTANSTPNANSNAKSTIQVKLVLLGEAAVGKSSVALRFVNKEFQENKEPTIGAAFLTQKSPVGDKTIKYEIWDTAGQERFHSLAPMYYRNAQAAVVVYDITKKATLDKAIAWIKELQRQANGNIVIALCGNKLDLADETQEVEVETEEGQDENEATTARQVATQVGEETAREFGLLFFETSAKSGQGINDMFTEIAKKLPLDSIISSRNPYRPNQLNSGNGRIDLLRESGGADSLNGTRGDRANGNNAGFSRGGCC